MTAHTKEYLEQMVADRRHLHRHPEEGWYEFETTYFIVQRLQALGFEVLTGLDIINPNAVMGRNEAGVQKAIERALKNAVPAEFIEKISGYTGAVAVMKTARPGPVTALRFDIDALPLSESDNPEHVPNKEGFASINPGLCHACGHDGHTAVGLGVARWLKDHQEELKGTIKLIFQPAEEGVRGAAAIAASGIVDDVDWFVGAHIGCDALPGQVGVSHEGYLATTKFDLDIYGVQCAAGSPEKGHSALMCACATVMSLGSLPGHGKGITRVQVGKIISGVGRNIVAPHAYVMLEVRGESTEINDYMARNVETTVKGLAAAYECTYELKRMGEAVTYKGDEEAVELIKDAARQAEGVTSVVDMNAKVGSEDCTMLIRRIQEHGGKCAFFYFGCRHLGHHRGDFEIQDYESLPLGWGVFTGYIQRINGIEGITFH